MKALSIRQPWAELIARGAKVIENRTWQTRYRGVVAIHASQSRTDVDHDDLSEYPEMTFGAIVATARIIDCVPVERLPAHLVGNEHAHGPFCWLLGDVQRLMEPLPMSGSLGVFELSDSEQQAIAALRKP